MIAAVLLSGGLLAGVAAGAFYLSGRWGKTQPAPIQQRRDDPRRVEALPPLEVTRGSVLASASIDGSLGGTLRAPDGIEITIPPGAWAGTRSIALREAKAPAPPVNFGVLGVTDNAPTSRRSWYVEAGPSNALFAREVTVSIPLGPGAASPVLPMISVDERSWRTVDFGVRGGKLTFATRHFSPFQLVELRLAANPWYLAALGAAAVVFLVKNRAEELPSLFHKDAPFAGVPGLDSGPFDLLWSKKLPGVSSPNGFVDEAGYLRKIEEIAGRYKDSGGCSGLGAARSCRAEINEARRTFLMPPSVRLIEEALDTAHNYIESRRFASPAFRLPVYIVGSTGGTASGFLYNPYLGRRYMVMAPTPAANVRHTTALHELFHHYQAGYAFYDRNDLLPMTEASATLIEREASAHYSKQVSVELLRPDLNNAFFDAYSEGLDGPAEQTESALQMHGYGLSWFLEYLRDSKYPGDKGEFHRELLCRWGETYVSAHHRTLRWAAGGTDFLLGDALDSFAFEKVLPGMTQSNPLGQRYFPQKPGAVFLKPFRDLDVTKTSLVDFGSKIPPFSIQFYRVTRPTRGGARVVVRIPRAWATRRPGRSVYLGQNAEQSATIRTLAQAEVAPGAEGALAHVLLRSEQDGYLFVVDKGVPSTWWWNEAFPEASLFVLEPPDNIKTSPSNPLDLSWGRPGAVGRGGLRGVFRIYAGNQPGPIAQIADSKSSITLDASRVPAGAALSMTWAVEVGTRDGKPVYVESERSGGSPQGVTVTPDALPPGWTSIKIDGWAAGAAAWKDLRLRKETRPLLHLDSSRVPPGTPVGVVPAAELFAAVSTSTKTVEQLMAECKPDPDPAKRLYSCFVTADATRTSIAGFPAWYSSFGAAQAGPAGQVNSAHSSFLVDVGGGTYVSLLASGHCTQVLPQARPECAGRAAALLAEAESIARRVRIEKRLGLPRRPARPRAMAQKREERGV